jgi:putative tryptophan/tyrosine transport system substrate-binding protein
VRRRQFITLVGGVAAWPMAARAQQPAMPVVGFISGGSPDGYAPLAAAFRQGLNESGYVEGRNVMIEFRWAQNQNDRLPALAADLVARQAVVIAAGGISSALAAKAATPTIPIVFEAGSDPVKTGLVASLNRPGGNVTGVSNFAAVLAPKVLALLHELVPNGPTVIAVLVNPTTPNLAESIANDMEAAGRALGLQIQTLNASTRDEIDAAFAALAQLRARALVIGGDPLFTSRRVHLAMLAARYGVPAIYNAPEFPRAGGLMSYGASLTDAYRQTGVYTGKVLKGAKPADLPVEQPTRFELIVNVRAAKAIGISVPATLLARADEVIE